VSSHYEGDVFVRQREYLRRLRNHLRSAYSPEEAQEIANGYREHFREQIERGKSEAEICWRLGRAERLAQDLITSAGRKPRKSMLGALAMILAVVVLLFIMITDYVEPFLGGYHFIGEFIGLAVMPSLAYRLLKRSKPPSARMWLPCAIPLLVGLYYYFNYGAFNYPTENMDGQIAGLYVVGNLYFFRALFLSAAAFSVFAALRKADEKYTLLAYPALGVMLASKSAYFHLMQDNNAATALADAYVYPFLWIVAGAAFGCAAWLIMLKRNH